MLRDCVVQYRLKACKDLHYELPFEVFLMQFNALMFYQCQRYFVTVKCTDQKLSFKPKRPDLQVNTCILAV